MSIIDSSLFLVQTTAKQSRLFCRYHDGNRNPRLLLKPMLEEDEWDSPDRKSVV